MPKPSALVLAAIRVLLGAEAVVGVATGQAMAVFVSAAALFLTFAPGHLAHRAQLTLPPSFLAGIAVFVMASLYLGELHSFYERLWWWDLALHFFSALGVGIIGFLLILMMFEGDRYAAPPWALGLLSFCLAITVGTLWEIFEYAMDGLFGYNMQKSGLQDTMGDLIVNAVGAAMAALWGVIYLSGDRGWTSGTFDAFVAVNLQRFRKHAPRRNAMDSAKLASPADPAQPTDRDGGPFRG